MKLNILLSLRFWGGREKEEDYKFKCGTLQARESDNNLDILLLEQRWGSGGGGE